MGIILLKLRKKGKDFGVVYLWVCLFFFAMIHAIVLPEKEIMREIMKIN
jgi:hypothetical protein